ncbi:MAG TPA: class I SAM-dependent methyltransferase [Anaeromyxobacter sp.]|nr:class I SAM-dependent methyltransferase [Anaeromyxobacter sp.]
MTDARLQAEEAGRIDQIYTARAYDVDPSYSDVDPVYLHRVQSIERVALQALRACGLSGKLSDVRLLDFGCGNGRWFGRWLAWGASAVNLHGCDSRASAVAAARERLPLCRFEQCQEGRIPFGDAAYDVVVQNLVFSSILDSEIRQHAAREMARVVRPGGIVLSYDFMFDNPRNPNVRGVRIAEMRSLFPTFEQIFCRRVVLAPPLARRLVPLSWTMASLAEALVPPLRTHVLMALRRP